MRRSVVVVIASAMPSAVNISMDSSARMSATPLSSRIRDASGLLVLRVDMSASQIQVAWRHVEGNFLVRDEFVAGQRGAALHEHWPHRTSHAFERGLHANRHAHAANAKQVRIEPVRFVGIRAPRAVGQLLRRELDLSETAAAER